MTSLRARTGGQILVDQLLIHGATHGFCVPGESYLAVLDALYDVQDTFTLINARHEAGAANMADCWGKLTGRPGVAFVTRGPGATHAAVGVHIARQDSTPMVLLVGQVARDMRGREAFQEVDYRALFTPIAKWVDEVDDAARLPELMARAFRVAMSGRPGPVVLALPEDMLTDVVTVADAPPAVAARAGADDSDIARLRTAMAEAKRPMVIVGGNWADTQATLALTAWAEAQNIPVLSSFRRQDIIDNASPSYAGGLGTVAGPGLKARLREADGLLLLGTRLSEISTDGYAFPTPDTRIWHVYPEAEELGRVWTPEVEIVADAARFATRLAQAHTQPWGDWADWCATLRQDYLADSTPSDYPGPLDMGAVMRVLAQTLPKETIVTVDAGNHTGWPQRFLRYTRPGRLIGSTCGAMGYAVPAAVAASIAHPDRPTVACVGDGGFQMSGLEIATAVQAGTRPIVLVFNNRSYGTIRMHQEKHHPGRVSGTDLTETDFVTVAQGLGAQGYRITRTEDAAPVLEAALKADGPVVIELVCDVAQISTRGRLPD